jgi:hypothetical protein
MLRRGNCSICLRRRLFFPPQLGIGVEGVARPLPGVVEPVQFAAQRVFGEVLAGAAPQLFSEQADRPLGGGVAEVLRRMPEQLEQTVAALVGQEARPSRAVAVAQDIGVMAPAVRLDPEVDSARRHPQAPGHAGDGLAVGNFEDGQGAAIDAGVEGLLELPFQAAPLPGGQRQSCHCGLLYLHAIR